MPFILVFQLLRIWFIPIYLLYSFSIHIIKRKSLDIFQKISSCRTITQSYNSLIVLDPNQQIKIYIFYTCSCFFFYLTSKKRSKQYVKKKINENLKHPKLKERIHQVL
ncbi:hypothetical protein C2G38_1458165 [Gigaspora rosea]|uniref:Transmembrane protein n=1 Tax=Gigaspora rosea TaxID=44941 RepID=A0A397V500_9GLOM|nr:hypothetical protein C2G38_1458165 [Gigaspora rosea]